MKNSHTKKYKIILSCAISAFVFLVSFQNAFASPITPGNVSYLVNKERVYYGLSPLSVDNDLARAARNKSHDMLNRNYFEHYAYGLTPWDFISVAGYKYLYAGENLAMDFDTAEGMVNAWLNSPMHRKNILSEDFEDMGLGIVKGVYTENGQNRETTIVTNMFGRKKPAIVELFNNIIGSISNLFSR